jgi:hypothetical protein
MLKQLWTKIKDFWFSFGEQEPDDYFYLKNGSVKWFRSVKPDVELTHREVQQLRSLLKHSIEIESTQIDYDKSMIQYHWELCNQDNKDDPQTSRDFYWLNYHKDSCAKSKANIKKLVNLQTKLKRLKGI